MNDRPCPLCGSRDPRLLLTGADRLLGIPGEFKVLACPACGLKFTDQGSLERPLSEYYPDSYAPYAVAENAAPGPASPAPGGLKAALKRSPAGPFLAALSQGEPPFVPDLPPGASVLEIGCASGNFLHGLAARNWRLRGVELNDFAAGKARKRGLDVFTGTVEAARFPAGSFDAVFAFQVVEHLTDPVATFREVNRILAEGGTFVFALPNAGSLEFRLFGSNWYALDLPRHLFHFDPETVRKALEKAGFRASRVIFNRSCINIFGSLAYAAEGLAGPNPVSRALRRLTAGSGLLTQLALYPLTALLARTGLAGQMTVIAEK